MRVSGTIRRAMANPVLEREIRQRWRHPRPVVVMTICLAVFTLAVRFLGEALLRSGHDVQCVDGSCFAVPNLLAASSAGRAIVHGLLLILLLAVAAVVPALAAGAIAGEREWQTLPILQITLLRPIGILTGKLTATLAYVALLVVATVPVFSIAAWSGGVAVGDIARGMAMVLFTAAVLCALGLLCSTLVRRSQGATVLAYGLAFVLFVGTFMVYGSQAAVRSLSAEPGPPPPYVLLLNPVVATADALGGEPGAVEHTPSPFTPIQVLLHRTAIQAVPIRADGPIEAALPDRPAVPYWLISVLLLTVLSAVSLWLAAKRLDVPRERGP